MKELGYVVFDATFNIISSILAGKPECPENTTDMSQVTDKLYHIMFDQVHLVMSGIQTHNPSDDRHCLHI